MNRFALAAPTKVFLHLLIFIVLFAVSFAQEKSVWIVKFQSASSAKAFVQQGISSPTMSSVVIQPFLTSSQQTPSTLSVNASQHWDVLQRYVVITFQSAVDIAKINDVIANEQTVEYAQPLQRFHIEEDVEMLGTDEYFVNQWNVRRIEADKVWKNSTGKGVKVGVIDTGIDAFHPDLQGQLWINEREDRNGNGAFEPWSDTEKRDGVAGDFDGIDNDGNGYLDDVIGYDFVDQVIFNVGDASLPDPFPNDEHGHGTQCAGIVSAKPNNSIGIAGIAPDAKIVTLRAFDATGNGEEDDIARAVVYAALNGVRVVNMSFGDIVESPLMQDAVRFAHASGCVMVASSGNENNKPLRLLRRFPASYPEVIAVGAVLPNDSLASFSSYGSYLGLTAPGVAIPTTRRGGGYNLSFQGTSAAAPHVAAAAALLLEKKPELTADDVLAVLSAAADDAGAEGWDEKYGAGIVNVNSALQLSTPAKISIDFPRNNSVFHRDRSNFIPVVATTLVPLFSTSELFFREGSSVDDIENWTKIGETKTTRQDYSVFDTLFISGKKDGSYTIRLLITQTNGHTIEKRSIIDFVSGDSPLNIVSSEILNVYRSGRRAAVCTAEFSQRCEMEATVYRINDNKAFRTYSNQERIAKQHTLLFDQPTLPPGVYRVVIMAKIPGIDTIFSTIDSIEIESEQYIEQQFLRKPYSLPLSYLCSDVADVYNSGNDAIAAVNSEQEKFGSLRMYEFENNRFAARDSLNQQWIPQAFGDSNGDGNIELLSHNRDMASLFQRSSANPSPFSSVVFTEQQVQERNNRKEFWSATMADVNGDGKPELIGFSDTACVVYTYSNGEYRLLAVSDNSSPVGRDLSQNTHRRPYCAVGDVDNNGKIDICFADADADIMVFEWDGMQLTNKYQQLFDGEGGTEFLRICDVDGNGKNEVLFGYYLPTAPDAAGEYFPSLWVYRLLSFDENNGVKELWKEYFYGVRVGSEYERGVAVGDLNKKTGDEIFISAFPDSYIFQWSETQNTMKIYWHYPQSLTRTAIIHDFDKNGTKEIGFTTFSNVSFFELRATEKSLLPPANITAEGTDNPNDIILRWSKVVGTEQYRVFGYELTQENPLLTEYVVATADSATIGNLKTDNPYRFYIISENQTLSSELSYGIDAVPHNRVRALAATHRNSNAIMVKFNGNLPYKPLPTSLFLLKDLKNMDNSSFPSSSQIVSDSLVLLTFYSIPDSAELFVDKFYDRFLTATVPSMLTVNKNFDNISSGLYISNINVASSTELIVALSFEALENTMLDVSNYILTPFGNIQSAQIISPMKIRLKINPNSPLTNIGKPYLLTIENLAEKDTKTVMNGRGKTIGFTVKSNNFDNVYIYPHPIKLSERPSIMFAGLPVRSTVYIMTLDGSPIAELTDRSGFGGVEWDGRQSNGEEIHSGIYVYRVETKNSDGSVTSSSLKKLSVVR